MQADIYSASVTQDVSGAAVRQWVNTETIDCTVRSMVRKGVGFNSTEIDINNYLNVINSMVKMRSKNAIKDSVRVRNIKNANEVIYKEEDTSDTIFEPRGSVPIMNFDGSIIEYETVLLRQEVQEL